MHKITEIKNNDTVRKIVMDFAIAECVMGGIFLCTYLIKQISIFVEKKFAPLFVL